MTLQKFGLFGAVTVVAALAVAVAVQRQEAVPATADSTLGGVTSRSTDGAGEVALPETSRVKNRFGETDVAKYAQLETRSTHDAPYGPLLGGGSLAAIDDVRELVQAAEAALIVDVVEIGLPHFNSADGGFWLEDEANGGPIPTPIQDVRVRVVEEWGDRIGIHDEALLTVSGGSIAVELNAEQAHAAEQPGPGRYVYSVEPPVELREGERALLFVASDPIPYREGARESLHVLGGYQGKFVMKGGRAENANGWRPTIAELRALVATELGVDPDYED